MTMPTNENWGATTFGDGIFLAVSVTNNVVGVTNAAARSTNGTAWTAVTMPTTGNWFSVTHGNGTFFAVSGPYSASSTAASSTDGITWTLRTLPANKTWQDVIYGGPLTTLYSSPALNNLYKNVTIAANSSEILEPGITLGAQNSIVIKGNSNLTFSAYGMEIS
jgi:hypothetical protein